MDYITAEKTYDVDFTALSSGGGYWHMPKGTAVTFNKLLISLTLEVGDPDDDSWRGYAFCYHDRPSHDNGLCYTDNGIEHSVEAFMKAHPELSEIITCAGGSEAGMQESLMFNMDIDCPKKLSREDLERVGYETVEWNY